MSNTTMTDTTVSEFSASETLRYLFQPTPGDSGTGRVAYRQVSPKSIGQTGPLPINPPGILFCGGFNSNLDGSKAAFLHHQCADAGLGFSRFDYRGHGASDGRFADGTIGDWLADAALVLDQVCHGPQIIVGSSMGAWIALLLARAHPARIHGLVLLAPAPDFTRRLILPPEGKAALERDGVWYRPSEYSDEPYPITQRLVDESADHELLTGPPVSVPGPVHILHGDHDEVVPVTHAELVASHIQAPSVSLDIIPGGDHRLSTDANLAQLWQVVHSMAASASR